MCRRRTLERDRFRLKHSRSVVLPQSQAPLGRISNRLLGETASDAIGNPARLGWPILSTRFGTPIQARLVGGAMQNDGMLRPVDLGLRRARSKTFYGS